MKFLIIADPISTLNPETDSGLALLKTGQALGHEGFWAGENDLFLWREQIFLRLEKAEFPLSSFTKVFIRKDPPFDTSYFTLCQFLALEENRVFIINRPSLLLRYHEKALPFEAVRAGFLTESDLWPTWVISQSEVPIPADFPAGEVVSKPWLGHGGRDIQKYPDAAAALRACSPGEKRILQPLAPVATLGDRRVFFIHGQVVGDFVRFPAEGKIESNLAQGGRAELKPMSPSEQDLAHRLGNFLKKLGIDLAGADFLAGKLTEVNITAPTGFRTLEKFGKTPLRNLF